MTTLRGFLGLIGGAGLLLAACGGAAPPATSVAPGGPASSTSVAAGSSTKPSVTPTTLAVSHPEGGAHLPLFYAQEKGYFSKHGLNVELKGLGGGAPAAAALQGNQVQIADITGSTIAALNAAGGDIIVLATLDPVYPYVLEAPPDVKTPADLKGKGIAVRSFGDATDVAARVALKQLGLEVGKDVQIVEVQTEGARMAAVQAGKICCTVAQPQDVLLLEAQGFHQLFDFATLGGKNAQGVIAVQRSYAAANRASIQAFMDALVESIPAIKADKPGAIQVLKKQMKLDDDKVATVLFDYFFGNNVVPNNPVVTNDQFTDGIAILATSNEKMKGFTMDKFIDTSFLTASLSKVK